MTAASVLEVDELADPASPDVADKATQQPQHNSNSNNIHSNNIHSNKIKAAEVPPVPGSWKRRPGPIGRQG